jgi:hypothetical protein
LLAVVGILYTVKLLLSIAAELSVSISLLGDSSRHFRQGVRNRIGKDPNLYLSKRFRP